MGETAIGADLVTGTSILDELTLIYLPDDLPWYLAYPSILLGLALSLLGYYMYRLVIALAAGVSGGALVFIFGPDLLALEGRSAPDDVRRFGHHPARPGLLLLSRRRFRGWRGPGLWLGSWFLDCGNRADRRRWIDESVIGRVGSGPNRRRLPAAGHCHRTGSVQLGATPDDTGRGHLGRWTHPVWPAVQWPAARHAGVGPGVRRHHRRRRALPGRPPRGATRTARVGRAIAFECGLCAAVHPACINQPGEVGSTSSMPGRLAVQDSGRGRLLSSRPAARGHGGTHRRLPRRRRWPGRGGQDVSRSPAMAAWRYLRSGRIGTVC